MRTMPEPEPEESLNARKRSFLRQSLPAEDGRNLADEIAQEREESE